MSAGELVTRSRKHARRIRRSRGARIARIEGLLRKQYGQPRHHNPEDPVDDLIFIVLSRMTQETKYVRAYARIREALPSWGEVRDAPAESVETLIADAGLAPTKVRHIQAILAEIERRERTLDLARLRSLPNDAVEAYLTALPGVSRKTALCVMLYTLGRDVLPVDAHVWRICQRIGLAPQGRWSEKGGRALESAVPAELRGSLHMTLIAHGRAICRAGRPRCGECVLQDLCRHGRSVQASPGSA